MNKKIYGYAFLAIVAVVAIHYFFFYNPCSQPSPDQVAKVQLQCITTMDTMALRKVLCEELYGVPNCNFHLTDASRIDETIMKYMLACTIKELKAKNMCVDKLSE